MRIQDFMTACPHFIDASAGLDEAMKKMNLQGIRHLPVVDKSGLIGVLSEEDANLSQFVCQTTNFCPTVGDLCVNEVYTVTGDTDIADVALTMAEKKVDCAVVIDGNDQVVGIFTTVDACRLLHLTIRGK